ncbi:MAG TPA: MCP four helix bundle domain-containing protein, partial [Burkholderiales bacterium]|nr:MCP four helix bundle domain-containing protein [Burkholderiales bacterium]
MKLVNLKVATRLALGFAVVVIGALLLGASGWYGIHRQSQVITTVIDRDVQFLRAITSIRARVQLLRRYEKDMLLNVKNAAKVTEYRGKWNESRKRMDELLVNARAVAATPEESKRLEQFTANVARYTAAMAQIEEHLASGFIVSAEQGNQKVDEFRQVIRDTEDLTQELFEGANKRIEGSKPVLAAAERDVMLALAVVMLAVLVLAALAAILITRSITGPVQEAVRVAEALAKGDLTQKVEARSNDELGRLMLALRGTVGQLASIVGRIKETSDMVNTASREIAQGNSDLSTRTEEQASALEETSASMQQMTATVGQNAQNAKK